MTEDFDDIDDFDDFDDFFDFVYSHSLCSAIIICIPISLICSQSADEWCSFERRSRTTFIFTERWTEQSIWGDKSLV